jgi:hypothetical protein
MGNYLVWPDSSGQGLRRWTRDIIANALTHSMTDRHAQRPDQERQQPDHHREDQHDPQDLVDRGIEREELDEVQDSRRIMVGNPQNRLMQERMYVVVSGYYSDMIVICAFTNEERARAFCAERNHEHGYECDEYHIDAVDIDPPLPSEVKTVRETFAWTRTDSGE